MGAGPSAVRFVGVYNANGTVIGELAYVIGRTVRAAHCALCDITHGRARERQDWRDAKLRLPVPFDVYHRNDQPAAVRAATGGRAPVVVAEFSDGRIEVVADDDALAACAGSPQRLVDQLLAFVGEDRPGAAGQRPSLHRNCPRR